MLGGTSIEGLVGVGMLSGLGTVLVLVLVLALVLAVEVALVVGRETHLPRQSLLRLTL